MIDIMGLAARIAKFRAFSWRSLKLPRVSSAEDFGPAIYAKEKPIAARQEQDQEIMLIS
jgi:hypothetical protein